MRSSGTPLSVSFTITPRKLEKFQTPVAFLCRERQLIRRGLGPKVARISRLILRNRYSTGPVQKAKLTLFRRRIRAGELPNVGKENRRKLCSERSRNRTLCPLEQTRIIRWSRRHAHDVSIRKG